MKTISNNKVLAWSIIVAAIGITVSSSSICEAAARNLVPDQPGTSPNYWCTWAAQNYVYGQGFEEIDPAEVEGWKGAEKARSNINEQLLFDPAKGWLNTFYSKCREDLYIVLDDGWDVPLDGPAAWYSSFLLNEGKFPGYAKLSPGQRLIKLNKAAKDAGWRGIGLWLAAQESSGARGDLTDEEYWLERIKWCKDAGIEYWKVDWGHKSSDNKFRKFLTDLAAKEYPELVVEHAVSHDPFNEIPRIDAGWVDQIVHQASFSGVVRLYDLSPQLSVPAMLDRVAWALKTAENNTSSTATLNCDDEPYLAAAAGICMGVLRHPMTGLRPDPDPDLFFNGPRFQKKRTDEVARCARWHRIAPAFPVGSCKVELDDNLLTDSWKFESGDFWAGIGQTINQNAPARVSRGLPLADVKAEGQLPYVVASKNPNGAVSIATLGRMSHKTGWSEPKADVSLSVGEIPHAIGVFGVYKSLTLEFDTPIAPQHIWAQDIAGDKAVDIYNDLKIAGNKITLSGELIEKIGLSAATKGDVSGPGLVIVMEAGKKAKDRAAK
jgi:hypothetical protein